MREPEESNGLRSRVMRGGRLTLRRLADASANGGGGATVGYLFEWDTEKAAANVKKHGVNFEEAWRTPSGRRARGSSLRAMRHERSDEHMKRHRRVDRRDRDRDTMRTEYDFSKGERGVTAGRYAEGTNVVVIDPAVLDVFPDGASINETLRALAPVLRQRRGRG